VYKPGVLAHCHKLEELPIRFQKLQAIYNNKSQMLANLNHLNKIHAKSSLQRINTIEESRISQLWINLYVIGNRRWHLISNIHHHGNHHQKNLHHHHHHHQQEEKKRGDLALPSPLRSASRIFRNAWAGAPRKTS
jgi:hypothetical protein